MQKLNIRAGRPTVREIQNYRRYLLGSVLIAACAHCIASIT